MYEPDGTFWNIAFATGPDRNGQSTGVWRYVIYKVTPPQTEEEKKNPWLRSISPIELTHFQRAHFYRYFWLMGKIRVS